MNTFKRETTAATSDERGRVAKMRASGKTIAIFFGSQTGTAEEYARRLAKTARMYGLKAQVIDPEEIEIVSALLYKLIHENVPSSTRNSLSRMT